MDFTVKSLQIEIISGEIEKLRLRDSKLPKPPVSYITNMIKRIQQKVLIYQEIVDKLNELLVRSKQTDPSNTGFNSLKQILTDHVGLMRKTIKQLVSDKRYIDFLLFSTYISSTQYDLNIEFTPVLELFINVSQQIMEIIKVHTLPKRLIKTSINIVSAILDKLLIRLVYEQLDSCDQILFHLELLIVLYKCDVNINDIKNLILLTTKIILYITESHRPHVDIISLKILLIFNTAFPGHLYNQTELIMECLRNYYNGMKLEFGPTNLCKCVDLQSISNTLVRIVYLIISRERCDFTLCCDVLRCIADKILVDDQDTFFTEGNKFLDCSFLLKKLSAHLMIELRD